MSERHFFGKDSMSSISKEQTDQRRETELTREQMELRRAMLSSVFSWMERLVTAPKPPSWKALSRSRDYGAAFFLPPWQRFLLVVRMVPLLNVLRRNET